MLLPPSFAMNTHMSCLTITFCTLQTDVDGSGPVDDDIRKAWEIVMKGLWDQTHHLSWGTVSDKRNVLFLSIGKRTLGIKMQIEPVLIQFE